MVRSTLWDVKVVKVIGCAMPIVKCCYFVQKPSHNIELACLKLKKEFEKKNNLSVL